MDEVGLDLVVAQLHPGEDRRFVDGASSVSADIGQPRRRRRRPAHQNPVGDCRHERGRVGPVLGCGSGRCGGRGRGGRGRPAARHRDVIAHQLLDLVAGERAAQVAHRPASREHFGLVCSRTAQDELALVETADRRADRLDIDATIGRTHAVQQPVLVTFGLQPSDHPRPGVGDCLVIDVDGILGGQHDTDTERSGLFHQGHDRLLRGRRRRRREVAGHFVHVQQGPEVGGAALVSHPGDELGE